ncbi:MAG: pyruvate kinase [Patescibacteria group bacterium]|jgi:pyruvate kinase
MRTKIICTIGPSTENEKAIKSLIENNMGVARMNFSHGDHTEHNKKIDLVRKVAKSMGKNVQILCDLQGPKIRVANFTPEPRKLVEGQIVTLTTSVCNEIKPKEIVIEDPYLHGDVKKGDQILFDDGQIELEIIDVTNHKMKSRVLTGGDLYSRKGVNLPDTSTTTSSLTEKDIEDLKFCLTKNPEWIAISFVQSAEDVRNVKKLLGKSKARIMCKIERANAIENLPEIIKEADGIMVARGDLGVEIPAEKLPIIQKQIIKKCNYAGKPVVTATQMLASMTKSPVATRAEVSDIANAVIDGTDAVMLSNETAVGKYPIQAATMMRKVIEETESYWFNRKNKL